MAQYHDEHENEYDLRSAKPAITINDAAVEAAWEAFDAKSGYSKPERFRAALLAAQPHMVPAETVDGGDLIKRLTDAANDPMWDAHAEVSKITLRRAVAEITRLRSAVAAARQEGIEDAARKADAAEAQWRTAAGDEQFVEFVKMQFLHFALAANELALAIRALSPVSDAQGKEGGGE